MKRLAGHRPLAFLLTISCRGHRLHGNIRGSVDADHNTFGTPLLPSQPRRELQMRRSMAGPNYVLDHRRRVVLRKAIIWSCWEHKWGLRALHIRTTHLHCVISADKPPRQVIGCLKANGSRWLARTGLDPDGTNRWAKGGSCRWLWDEKQVAEAVDYVLHQQGKPMETYYKPE